MNPYAHIFQTHDELGHPAPAEFVQPIVPRPSRQTLPEAARDFLLALTPSRSSRSGVYFYRDQERGSGRITLKNMTPSDRQRVDQMVHLFEIEREIGKRDPRRIPDLPNMANALILNIRNPYLHALFGAIFLAPCAAMLYSPLILTDASTAKKVIVAILGGCGVWLSGWTMAGGIRRVRWWSLARSLAKRDGGPIPDELRIWD